MAIPEHRLQFKPEPEINANLIAQVTLQMLIKYALIGMFVVFWVGPVFLPWLTQMAMILTGG